MKSASLEEIVPGNGKEVGGRSWVPQSDVTPPLPEHLISEAFQEADQTVAGHATRQFHAASTGTSSSLT